MIRRPYRHQRARSQFTPAQSPPGPNIGVTIALVASKSQLTFSSPIVASALPTQITRQAAGAGPQLLPVSYTIDSATQITLTYAANCVVTDVITVPANVSTLRGVAGGMVNATVKTF